MKRLLRASSPRLPPRLSCAKSRGNLCERYIHAPSRLMKAMKSCFTRNIVQARFRSFEIRHMPFYSYAKWNAHICFPHALESRSAHLSSRVDVHLFSRARSVTRSSLHARDTRNFQHTWVEMRVFYILLSVKFYSIFVLIFFWTD